MNTVFYFDICALVVFLTILGTSYFKKMIRGKTNLIFFFEVALCSLTSFVSIICSILFGFVRYNLFTMILASLFEYIYIFLNTLILPVAIIYILSSIGILKLFEKRSVYIYIFAVLLIIPSLFIIDNLFSHKLFVISSTLTLRYGTHYKYIYLLNIIYIFICVALVIIYRNFLQKSKIIIGLLMCPILIFFIFFEYYFSDYKFILFVYSIVCYLISTSSQRPELLINPTVGVWSDFTFFNECKKGYLLNRPSTVIFIKILNYKSLILYFGRNNYNSFVRQISAHISLILRSCNIEDSLYYLEDFTFAIYLENVSPEMISLVSGEIYYDLSRETSYDKFKILLNPCICVANLPADIENYDSLKYFAKSFHHILPEKKAFTLLSDVVFTKEFKMKNEIESILNRAIKENNFEVYYQPIYSLKEKKFTSAEALLRLNDPDFGFIPPALFIPPAEANGSILQIGDFVFENVCSFIASQEFQDLGLDYIEMNLSLSQCAEVNLVGKITNFLTKYSIKPEKIRLEIDEATVAANPTITIDNISKLTEQGVYFALDNYGVGYSNIRTVTQLPFSLIKLDKSFINDLNDEKMLEVLHDVIHMLKALKKEVLIEGIENESAVKIFSELQCDLIQGCEYVQGFYYSKPLTKEKFIEFLHNTKNSSDTLSL